MRRARLLLSAPLLCLLVLSCQGDTGMKTSPREDSRSPEPKASPSGELPDEESAPQAPLVVFLGDSLTAGYGLDGDDAYPAVLGRRLAEEGTPVRVVNAGVSGDTTAGGLRRLAWTLRQKPDVLVLSLGANDGLRALDLSMSEENLRQIIRQAQDGGARVLLTGMLVPPNYGPDYAREFKEIYPRLSAELKVPLVPFLLEGVGGNPELNQSDGIHPNREGQRRVAEVVLPHLRAVLAELPANL